MSGMESHEVNDLRNSTEDVSSIAETFYKLFYDTVDTKRHLVTRLYMETAVLVWNGNPYHNISEIQKFYEELPTTTHSISCVDSQLLSSSAVGAQKTLLIQTAGKAKLHEGSDRSFKSFQQTFIVTAQGDKWKIVSDICRQQVPLDSLGVSAQDQQLQQIQYQQQQQLQQLQQQQQIQPPPYYSSPGQQFQDPAQLLQLQQQQLQMQQQLQQQQLQQQMQLQQPQSSAQFTQNPFNFSS